MDEKCITVCEALREQKDSWVKGVVLNLSVKNDIYQKPYTDITLSDSTGELTVRIWGRDETSSLNIGDVVKFFLCAESGQHYFSASIVNNVVSYTKLEDEKVSNYLKKAPISIKQMLTEIKNVIEEFQDQSLKSLCSLFFSKYQDLLKTFPAGLNIHHNYLAGLLYHIYGMLKIAEPMVMLHGDIDKEMLYTGIFLHDIGKFKTFAINPITRLATDYTIEGTLNDHISIGLEDLINLLSECPVAPDKAMRLKHMLLSHHGEYSVVKPKTLEAELLSKIDLIDSRIDIYKIAYGSLEEGTVSDKNYYLKNRVYKPC